MDTQILKKAVKKAGGVRLVAEQLGVSRAAVYMYLNGQRQPSDDLLELLGLEVRLVRAK